LTHDHATELPDRCGQQSECGSGNLCGMSADAVLIRGPTGIGKTSCAWFLHKLLRDGQVPHAALDIDWLTASWPEQGEWNIVTRHRHVALIADSYRREIGVRYFVVSGTVTSAESVEQLRQALGSTELAVCRLHAPFDVVEARLRRREPAEMLPWFLERAALLQAQLPLDGLDDFVIDASQPVEVVAQQVAKHLGWLPTPLRGSETSA
jgi:adenylylsulfate kinase